MINRIYVNNYRCFSNFECRFGPMQLLLGDNGSGKTSVFDVFEVLRDFIVHGLPTNDAFPIESLTAWDRRSEQTFELGIKGNGGEYLYKLIIDHNISKEINRIKSEDLRYDGKPLYQFDGYEAHLFHDDHNLGPSFPSNWARSLITTIPVRDDNRKLTWFRNRMEKVFIFSPDPVRMIARSETELLQADRQMHHLASWLRHLWQQQASFGSELLKLLQEVVEGLIDINLEPIGGNTREFQLKFQFDEAKTSSSSNQFSLRFDQLSDGQRNLIALYTILLAAIHDEATLCLDEPDNFISLREVQPWLVLLQNRVQDTEAQCLIISHHPELIDYLAADCGLNFFREENGSTRVKPFEWTGEDVLTPAELVARGWK